MRELLVVITFCIFLVVGCSGDGDDSVKVNIMPTKSYAVVEGTRVQYFELEDGTRCVLHNAYRAGGLSCDWVKRDNSDIKPETIFERLRDSK